MTSNRLIALVKLYSAPSAKRAEVANFVRSIKGNVVDPKMLSGFVSSIEAKAGTLLSHISTMIAVTGILLALTKKSEVLNWFFGIELVVYLILALLCIRCQFQFDHVSFKRLAKPVYDNANSNYDRQYERVLESEFFYRSQLFRIVLTGLYLATAVLTIMIVILVANGEFSLPFGASSGASEA